MDTPASQNTG